jgi:peptidoglycan/xylan/chitin deacetylase (PgdA/CDA1 family)
MGVVYSSKLWDNKRLAQIRKAHKMRHFYSAVILGIVIGSMASLVIFSLENTRAQASEYSTKPATQAVAGVSTEEQTETVQKLFPVGNNFSGLPLQKKTEEVPAPPASPDCTVQACLALSFDDGPDPVNTPKIMDSLSKQHVPATFFLIGNRVAPNALIVQRMYKQGFEIGNHSWAHPNLTKLTVPQILEQVNLTQQAIANLGVPPPMLFRPPYGAVNAAMRVNIHMAIIRWDVDPKDWALNDPNAVIANVEAQAKPGGIILMHSTHAATAAALDSILPNLKSRFQLVTVSQLLQLAPGAQGEYIGR